MSSYLNMGNGNGWFVGHDSQEEKEKAVSIATENVLRSLGKVVKIYAEFGNPAMFKAFENAVNETMKKASFESFFNDDNYENTGQ